MQRADQIRFKLYGCVCVSGKKKQPVCIRVKRNTTLDSTRLDSTQLERHARKAGMPILGSSDMCRTCVGDGEGWDRLS